MRHGVMVLSSLSCRRAGRRHSPVGMEPLAGQAPRARHVERHDRVVGAIAVGHEPHPLGAERARSTAPCSASAPVREKQSMIRCRHSTSDAASCGLFFHDTTSRRPVRQVKLAAPRGVRKQASAGVWSRTQAQMSAQAAASTLASARGARAARPGSGQCRVCAARSAPARRDGCGPQHQARPQRRRARPQVRRRRARRPRWPRGRTARPRRPAETSRT